MEWLVFFLLIFIIIVLESQVRTLNEDKYFLKEDNISLRNDLKKVLFKTEIFEERPQKVRKDKNCQEKKIKSGKATKEKSKIFIFENPKTEEDAEKLVSFRNLLIKHCINRVILVSFEDLSLKMSDDDEEAVIEEIFLLKNNPDNLPIIFYGGDCEDFIDFLLFCEWEERKDMEWIENPWEVEDIKEVLKEIKER